MKRLTAFLAVAGLALGAASITFAQAAGPAKQGDKQGAQGAKQGAQGGQQGNFGARRAKMNEEIFAKLNLTAAQKTKIQALQKKSQEKMRALMQKPGDRQAKRPEFQKLMKENHDALMAILTPAQRTKFEALRKEAMEKLRGQRGQGGPGRPGGGGTAAKPPAKNGKGG
ncbi:MAG TPA: hypothetical protein VM328_07580 [Fimbriimonadaceae bacterium]|nr:hypothetical protein [Fimbriimonadaceae bacterium]